MLARFLLILLSFMGSVYSASIHDEIFISPAEALKLIDNPNVVFIYADSEDMYKLGHIRGSVNLYTNDLRRSELDGTLACEPMIRCTEDTQTLFRSLGLKTTDFIIVYDDYKGVNSAGLYTFFKQYGHKEVKILEGGKSAIMALDKKQNEFNFLTKQLRSEKRNLRNLESSMRKNSPYNYYKNEPGFVVKSTLDIYKDGRNTPKTKLADEINIKPENDSLEQQHEAQKKVVQQLEKQSDNLQKLLLVQRGDTPTVLSSSYNISRSKMDLTHVATTEEIEKVSAQIVQDHMEPKSSNKILLDIRSIREYIGERKMDNVVRGGHIPGARLFNWSQLRDNDNKRPFKNQQELKKIFVEFGITPEQEIYLYDQNGISRAAYVALALSWLGYPNVKLYSGSWDTWGNYMNLPIAR